MGQSNLSAKMTDLQATVGDYLGWGRGVENSDEEWTANKQSGIDECLDMALRWVYFEATLDPRMPPHQWSWLNFSISVVVATGERYTRLPDDFGGFASNMLTVSQDDGANTFCKIRIIGEPYLDEKYAMSPSVTGRPLFAADRAVRGVGETYSTRRDLYVYPVPDGVYTIRGPYNVLPDRLSSKAPYTYGGAAMSGCFISAARAAAEVYRDNIQPGAGAEWQIFQRSLAAAIQRDGQRHAAKSLGRNTDNSDPSRRMGRGWRSDGEIASVDPVTYDDTLYD
jgi:hypothetical protein